MKFDKKNTLKKLVTLLREAEEVKKEDGEDSLDSQIDRYFSDYESEAKNSKNEGLNLRSITQRLLKEEEDEVPEDASEEKLSAEDLDMKTFVSSVMRLIDNYDNLLEINNTILRRAANFIAKSYDEAAVETFKEELMESYGVEIGKSKSEKEDEFEAPKAGAAGPMGGGGAA